MEDLKKRVKAFQSKWNVGKTVKVDYYTSSVGQHYAILVTKGLWYKIRLFVEDEHPNCLSSTFMDRVKKQFLSECDCWTWKGVESKIHELIVYFESPDYDDAHVLLSGNKDLYLTRKVPKDYSSDPDKYLKREATEEKRATKKEQESFEQIKEKCEGTYEEVERVLDELYVARARAQRKLDEFLSRRSSRSVQMEELKKRVTAYQSKWNVAKTVKVDYYTSKVGQHYAILVTKGLWYKIRLFVEDEHPNCPSTTYFDAIKTRALIERDRLNWKDVKVMTNAIKRFFRRPNTFKATTLLFGNKDLYLTRKVPKDYSTNPDKYLKRGDIIASKFGLVAFHTGIYLGNGKVAHMSGHGEGKAAAVARIGDLIPNFVSKGTDNIWVICLPLRIRKREEIALWAETLAEDEFGLGDYNLVLNNCQNFVFLCATGDYDVLWQERFLGVSFAVYKKLSLNLIQHTPEDSFASFCAHSLPNVFLLSLSIVSFTFGAPVPLTVFLALFTYIRSYTGVFGTLRLQLLWLEEERKKCMNK